MEDNSWHTSPLCMLALVDGQQSLQFLKRHFVSPLLYTKYLLESGSSAEMYRILVYSLHTKTCEHVLRAKSHAGQKYIYKKHQLKYCKTK